MIAGALLVFCYGLFCISAQTLLFREFVGALEGHDLAVGLFFAFRFLWVGVGAALTRRFSQLFASVQRHPQLGVLAYLPLFILELLLMIHFRHLAGIPVYAALSLGQLLVWSVLINAPVSLLTGFLFPALSTWWEQEYRAKVTHVYIWEAIGSLCGGIGITLGLVRPWSPETLFLVLSLIVAAGVGTSLLMSLRHSRRAAVYGTLSIAGAVLLLSSLGLVCRWDHACARSLQATKWSRLLPRESFTGAFHTAQAQYLYGTYQDQWIVMREGSVIEALPDNGRDGSLGALIFSQNPGTAHILVAGSGLGLCQGLLHLEPVQSVSWFFPDRRYPAQVQGLCGLKGDSRLQLIAEDLRTTLAQQPQRYDAVIVNLADLVGAATNRYFSEEFYKLVQTSLTDGGILLVTVPGDENVIGPELAYLGASTRQTLRQVFAHVLLVPGERTVFLATDLDYLTYESGGLRDRFAGLKGAHQVYAPDGLLSLYRPDKAEAVNLRYDQVPLSEDKLINQDHQPRFYLYSLLLAVRKTGLALTETISKIQHLGLGIVLVPISIACMLYAFYVRAHRPRKTSLLQPSNGTPFISPLLLFLSGWVSIGFVIILMTRFETRYGTLYLHVGLVTSLFMLGLSLGAWLFHRWLSLTSQHSQQPNTPENEITPRNVIAKEPKRLKQSRPFRVITGLCNLGGSPTLRPVFLTTILIQTTILLWLSLPTQLTAITPWLHTQTGMVAVLFALGLCTGTYFPWAAALLHTTKQDTATVARNLDQADHLGAAVGGLATSLILIPILGLNIALQCLAILLAANIIWELMRPWRIQVPGPSFISVASRRRLGYGLFALAVAVILCWHWITWSQSQAQEAQNGLPTIFQAWTDNSDIQMQSTTLDSGSEWFYHEIRRDGQLTGYIVQTEELAPKAYGFGGLITMGLLIDPNGNLLDFRFMEHYETPSYIDFLSPWFAGLLQKPLWGANTLPDVDTVSGATLTSATVIDILQRSGGRFAKSALGLLPRQDSPQPKAITTVPIDKSGILLLGLGSATLLIITIGSRSTRYLLLAITLILSGFWLNAQFSTEQIIGLLAGRLAQIGLTGRFVLGAGVLLLTLVFGNIYCGYLCPFGAFQEWLGCLWPKRWKLQVARETLQRWRFLKYVLLFMIIVLYFTAGNRSLMASDPLVWIFRKNLYQDARNLFRAPMGSEDFVKLLAAVVLLAGILLSTRFWCRFLCPTGAFLSLFNHSSLLKRWRPTYKYGRCEFGLTAQDRLDCIGCDRCRFGPHSIPIPQAQSNTPASASTRRHKLILALLILLTTGIWLIPTIQHTLLHPATQTIIQTTRPQGSAGEVRPVDQDRLQQLIQNRQLSDHEALYYRPVSEVIEPNSVGQ